VPVETILVTGGAGFIGSNFVKYMIGKGRTVINLDALTYAGNRLNLGTLEGNRHHVFVEGSIADRKLLDKLMSEYLPDAVVNIAAETHVDRSIDGPAAFVQTNIVGVFALLEASRSYASNRGTSFRNGFRFLHVSTDEVYGAIETGAASEHNPYAPSSPYAASKAAADHLVRAWYQTYGLPTIITNCSNNYGPYQFPEKLIPLMITKALNGEPLPIYGDGLQERDWLHVSDHCRALETVLDRGRPGETYNVASGETRTNREVVEEICANLDRLRPRGDGNPHSRQIRSVVDRPGHDRRYALKADKIAAELGWRPNVNSSQGFRETVTWYIENDTWVDAVQLRYAGERLGHITGA